MATVYEHLSVDELKERYVAGSDAAATLMAFREGSRWTMTSTRKSLLI